MEPSGYLREFGLDQERHEDTPRQADGSEHDSEGDVALQVQALLDEVSLDSPGPDTGPGEPRRPDTSDSEDDDQNLTGLLGSVAEILHKATTPDPDSPIPRSEGGGDSQASAMASLRDRISQLEGQLEAARRREQAQDTELAALLRDPQRLSTALGPPATSSSATTQSVAASPFQRDAITVARERCQQLEAAVQRAELNHDALVRKHEQELQFLRDDLARASAAADQQTERAEQAEQHAQRAQRARKDLACAVSGLEAKVLTLTARATEAEEARDAARAQAEHHAGQLRKASQGHMERIQQLEAELTELRRLNQEGQGHRVQLEHDLETAQTQLAGLHPLLEAAERREQSLKASIKRSEDVIAQHQEAVARANRSQSLAREAAQRQAEAARQATEQADRAKRAQDEAETRADQLTCQNRALASALERWIKIAKRHHKDNAEIFAQTYLMQAHTYRQLIQVGGQIHSGDGGGAGMEGPSAEKSQRLEHGWSRSRQPSVGQVLPTPVDQGPTPLLAKGNAQIPSCQDDTRPEMGPRRSYLGCAIPMTVCLDTLTSFVASARGFLAEKSRLTLANQQLASDLKQTRHRLAVKTQTLETQEALVVSLQETQAKLVLDHTTVQQAATERCQVLARQLVTTRDIADQATTKAKGLAQEKEQGEVELIRMTHLYESTFSKLQEQQERATQNRRALERARTALREKVDAGDELRLALAEREATIASLESRVAEREATIESLGSTGTENTSILATLRATVASILESLRVPQDSKTFNVSATRPSNTWLELSMRRIASLKPRVARTRSDHTKVFEFHRN